MFASTTQKPTLKVGFCVVEAARLELAASWSRTMRATNCATPRYSRRGSLCPLPRLERKTGIEPATFSLGSYCSTVEPFPHSSIDSKYYRKLGIFSILTNYITIVFVCQIVLCGFAKVFFRAYTYYARQRPRVTTCLLFRARRSLWFFRRTNQALCPRCGYAC